MADSQAVQNIVTVLSGAVGLKVLEFSFSFLQKFVEQNKSSTTTLETRVNDTMLKLIESKSTELEKLKEAHLSEVKHLHESLSKRDTTVDALEEEIRSMREQYFAGIEEKLDLKAKLTQTQYELNQANTKLLMYSELKDEIKKHEHD